MDVISKIPFFAPLQETESEALAEDATMHVFSAGEMIIREGEPGRSVYIILDGRVRVFTRDDGGNELPLATLGVGQFFGEMSLVGQGMHNTFAEAAEPCVLCVMSRSDIERLIREKPAIAFRFVEAMGTRLTQLETHLESIAFKSISVRLAALLLQLDTEQGKSGLVKGYTHQDLSEMLGTYRETITQTLNEFKADGWISIGRKKVTLLDMDALEALAME